jgi:hypothetical protein
VANGRGEPNDVATPLPPGVPTPVRQPSLQSPKALPAAERAGSDALSDGDYRHDPTGQATSRRSFQSSFRSAHTGRRSVDSQRSMGSSIIRNPGQRGMVLPFQPLSLVFHHMYYSVNATEVRPWVFPKTGLNTLTLYDSNVRGAHRP